MYMVVLIVSGIGVAANAYLVYLGYQAGAGIPWLSVAFGVFFGIPFVLGLVKILRGSSAFMQRIDEKLSGTPSSRTTFVPHWFMMAAIAVASILVLAAIILPIILKR
jgi:hypothetical protein